MWSTFGTWVGPLPQPMGSVYQLHPRRKICAEMQIDLRLGLFLRYRDVPCCHWRQVSNNVRRHLPT
jgi:hypothetical protein